MPGTTSFQQIPTDTVDHGTPHNAATGQRPIPPTVDNRYAEFDPYQDPALHTPSVAQHNERHDSDATSTHKVEERHPREGMAAWRWPAIQVMFAFILLLMGYDVSNIANIQAPIYHAFGHVELLPWIAVGFSAFCCAVMPMFTRLANVFGLKPLFATSQAICFWGCVLSGASVNTDMLIIGRALTGIGCAGIMNYGTLYNYLLTTPAEFPRAQGLAGMAFGIGLMLGPIVGGAFAENEHATWRWAIYINLPILAATFIATMVCIPHIYLYQGSPLHVRLRKFDWSGSLLHATTIILTCSVLIFSGSTWAWSSAPAIACWVLVGVFIVLYAVQQRLTLFTTPLNRVLPVHVLGHHRAIVPILLGTLAISAGYGITLYYSPLFFAFARGLGPLAASVRLLPYLATFVVAIFVSAGTFAASGHFAIFYIIGGVMVTGGSAGLTQLAPGTSESYVMGLEALIGFGTGLLWQLGGAVCSNLVASEAGDGGQGRRDITGLYNTVQLGGIAFSLSLAGCVFQNQGFQFLKDALGPFGLFSDFQLREALAGLESGLWESGPEARAVLPLAVAAVTKALGRVYYVSMAGGIFALIAGCFMGFEKIDMKKGAIAKKGDSEKGTRNNSANASRESHYLRERTSYDRQAYGGRTSYDPQNQGNQFYSVDTNQESYGSRPMQNQGPYGEQSQGNYGDVGMAHEHGYANRADPNAYLNQYGYGDRRHEGAPVSPVSAERKI